MDKFEKAREGVWGTPGFQSRRSTFTDSGTLFFPAATHVVTSISTDEESMVFLETIGAEGGERIVLPTKVVKAVLRHFDQMMAVRRSWRGKTAAQTRKQKAAEGVDDGT